MEEKSIIGYTALNNERGNECSKCVHNRICKNTKEFSEVKRAIKDIAQQSTVGVVVDISCLDFLKECSTNIKGGV